MLWRSWCIAMFGVAASGCERASPTPGAESATLAAPQWVSMSRATADSAVFREKYTGMWTTALVAKRLVDAGFGVTLTDSAIRYPHLSVEGKYIHLGRGDVHAFFYPDTAAARMDAARLDSTTAAPPGVAVKWTSAPTLVRNLNLVVIFLSDSPSSSQRFANAIMGGLRPPESDR